MASDDQRIDPAQDYAERRSFRAGAAEIAREAAPERKAAADPEAALRSARTRALVRHAVDAILGAGARDSQGSPEQMRELADARKAFEEVRPYGWRDAEAAYVKNPALVGEAAGGRVNRAILALQLETELRTDPRRRADHFVERWRKLDHASQRPASETVLPCTMSHCVVHSLNAGVIL